MRKFSSFLYICKFAGDARLKQTKNVNYIKNNDNDY